ncbi:hypothetical protein [Exiguobacterium sp.]|uniref:hypothetical protein n=1 Tax=Exiguobacterium sp. TaxID=44751 RepID=UPI00263B2412|nr:hypothetical protein [Exiguobacterium sp.]MCC5891102.1 hypothetical protein [Exiguobacterium sp.]
MNQEAEIIQALQAAASLTPTLTVKQYQLWSRGRAVPTVLDILDIYDSWPEALDAAGVSGSQKIYTQHELVTALRQALQEDGKLTSTSYRQWADSRGAPSLGDIISYFGSWSLAVKKAERAVDPRYVMQPEREKAEMIQALLEASQILHPFNAETYQKWAKQQKRPSVAKVARRFGSWHDALDDLELDDETCHVK